MMYSKDLFKGEKVLVTGGRSGIGYEIAKQFLQCGAEVFIASRKEEPLKKAAEALGEFGKCYYAPCDTRDIESVENLAEEIEKQMGGLTVLVNNAGGQFPSQAKDISANGWDAVIDNNLNGTFYVTKTMGNKFFIPQKNGNIVSIIANIFRGFPGMAHTGAARAGVENLTKTLAVEWCKYGVRVNCVAPGIIQSSGLDTYPPEIQEMWTKIAAQIPMKRLGTVEEVAHSVLFFASPLSTFTSGETLYVDGVRRLKGEVSVY